MHYEHRACCLALMLTWCSLLFPLGSGAGAEELTLAWDAHPEPVGGYKLHYGKTSHNYTTTVDVGKQTTYTVDLDFNAGKYYFAVTAYDITGVSGGGYSNEVEWPPIPLEFHTLSPPCRLVDTRLVSDGPALLARTTRTFTAAGTCGIPSDASALAVNATVTQPSSQGYLALFPAGGFKPIVSSVNYKAWQTRGNNGSVALNSAGEFAVYTGQTSGTVHFILDVYGYYK